MELKDIDYKENLDHTLEVMGAHGLLLTAAGAGGRPNVMTIGWGNVGIIWGRPMFLVYVRPSRYTFAKLAEAAEFVVNVPREGMEEVCAVCGTESGREVDKFAECNLTAVPAREVGAPLIEQCVRFYECRVAHRLDVRDGDLLPEVRSEYYPRGDLHAVYFGQILRAAEKA